MIFLKSDTSFVFQVHVNDGDNTVVIWTRSQWLVEVHLFFILAPMSCRVFFCLHQPFWGLLCVFSRLLCWYKVTNTSGVTLRIFLNHFVPFLFYLLVLTLQITYLLPLLSFISFTLTQSSFSVSSNCSQSRHFHV